MKINLFICDTPFQIMMALAFRMTILKNDIVDIVISDIINNSESLYQNVKESNVFSDAYYIRDYELNYGFQSLGKAKKIKKLLNRKKIIKSLLPVDKSYDALFVTDTLRSIDWIYEQLLNINHQLKVFYYEEGPIAVLCDQGNHFKKRKEYESVCKRLFNQVLGVKHINGNFQGAFTSVYNQMPKAYFEWYDLTRISRDRLDAYVEILNEFWNYKHTNMFSNKFIFLEESFFTDGRENRDLEIISDIVSVVGKKDIIVKLHPRTRENRFEKMGLTVYQKNNVPWELIALNGDLCNAVLICVGSGAILYPKLYWNIDQVSIGLLECEEYHYEYLDNQYYKTFSRICKDKELAILPQNKQEFVGIIKTYLKEMG